MRRLSARTENAVGIINENADEMILAVWNLSDSAREVVVDLNKYGMKNASIIYPSEVKNFEFDYTGNVLTCKFGVARSAKLFKLTK